ncbi:MAG TPA: MBL fold metallo-hydrolase, partial [Solirubrobacteraceae bacterium]
MRAVSLHRDVLVVTSALLQVNCVIVQGGFEQHELKQGAAQDGEGSPRGETFVIDSPVLPDELNALPALLEQAQFPAPSGLLATHGDWDHL